MGFAVQQIQPTPNPNAIKFILDRSISEQPASFLHAQAAKANRLAAELFAIPGVSGLLLLGDFVTVNKSPQASWKQITSQVRRVLSEAEEPS